MKLSFKTVLVTAVLGVVAVPMFTQAEDARPAPPEGGQRGPGGPGGPGGGQRGPGGRGMNPEAMLARLDEAVTLTADQKTKITEIYKKQVEAMQAVPQEERREKMPEIMRSTQTQIRALLTTEQQAKFDAMPPMGRGPGGPGGPGGQRPGGGKKE